MFESFRCSSLRVWGFRLLLAVCAPVLVLCVVELVMRGAGYGDPADPILVHRGSEGVVCSSNPAFHRFFFPRHLARSPEPFAFPKEKAAHTVRIFILGGSAAMGDPEPGYAFWRMLDVMLHERYPGKRFEIINMANVAVNSHVMRVVARDCARYEPDLFIVYMGNNEVIGPFGPGTVFTAAQSHPYVIAAQIAARRLRLGQWIGHLMERRSPGSVPREWRALAMFLEHECRADDKRLAAVYRNLEWNVRAICRAGTAAGAQVLLCSVPVNLKDCAPFASRNQVGLTSADALRWQAFYTNGVASQSGGDLAGALDAYTQAESIDPSYAECQFRLAEIYAAMEDDAAAATCYRKACDLDVLRFRADTAINAAIHAVARDYAGRGVDYLDLHAALAPPGDAPDVSGAEVFLDHVHLRFTGHYRLARAILKQLSGRPIAALRGTKESDAGALSEPDCAMRLAYTDWHQAELLRRMRDDYLKRVPFAGRYRNDEQIRALDEELQRLADCQTPRGWQQADALCRQALRLRPDDWRLSLASAMFLARGPGDAIRAEAQLRTVLRQVDHDGARTTLALVLRRQGRLDEAIALFEGLLADGCLIPTLHQELGLTYLMKGDDARAAEHFAASMRVAPSLFDSYFRLAEYYGRQGNRAAGLAILGEAETQLRVGIEREPTPYLYGMLGLALREQGRFAEAIDAFKTALLSSTVAEQRASLHERLGTTFRLAGDPRKAEAHYRLAQSIEAESPAAADNRQSTQHQSR